MKENFIHVCFVIDESGSMTGSESDVIGGFKKVIDDQKAVKEGSCAVSLFKFATKAEEVYRGKDVKDVEYLDDKTYSPGGSTAMNDGIGLAIDTVGKWLNGMKEEEKPEKNLIVIMTDGYENNSREYTYDKIREMIKHQEEKYNWTFMYLGTDITDAEAANRLGVHFSGFSDRSDVMANYCCISSIATEFRGMSGSTASKYATLDVSLNAATDTMNTKYEKKLGRKIANLKKSKA